MNENNKSLRINKLSSVNIFRMVAMITLICLIAFILIMLYYKHIQREDVIKRFKEKNIYEIVTMNPENENNEIWLTTYFMLCQPGKNVDEVKNQIDTFLAKNDVLNTLKDTYLPLENIENIQFHLVFIRPTNAWPIGKVSHNREHFDLWTGMTVATIFIKDNKYNYTYDTDDDGYKISSEI